MLLNSEKNPQIRVGALEGFRDLVFELGGNPSEILNDADIDESLWLAPDTLITTEQYRQALNIAATRTLNPRFGLLLSQRQNFNKFGAIGYLISHVPNLKTAFEHLPKYLGVHDTGTVAKLVTDGPVSIMTHTLAGIGNASTIQQTELGVGLLVKFIRSTVDNSWSPNAVYFSHSKQKSGALYHRIFRCPIYFDHDLSGIEFPTSDLQRPLVAADAKLYKILKGHIDSIRQSRGEDIVSQTRHQIHASIQAGSPYLGYVAEKLSLSGPELQRRLKREDTNFQTLLETERFGLAKKYLGDMDISLSAISVMLGYAELAVFSRAFKRLTGQSPRNWRKSQQLLKT